MHRPAKTTASMMRLEIAPSATVTMIVLRYITEIYEGRLKSFEPHHEDGATRQSHSGIIIVILTKDICDNCGQFGRLVLV